MQLVIWALCIFGYSMLISKTYIFKWLREWCDGPFIGKLVNCPICLSFWASASLFFQEELTSPTGDIFLDGFLAMGITWVLYSFCWGMALKDERF